jgi:hypothetical protein
MKELQKYVAWLEIGNAPKVVEAYSLQGAATVIADEFKHERENEWFDYIHVFHESKAYGTRFEFHGKRVSTVITHVQDIGTENPDFSKIDRVAGQHVPYGNPDEGNTDLEVALARLVSLLSTVSVQTYQGTQLISDTLAVRPSFELTVAALAKAAEDLPAVGSILLRQRR